MTSLFERYLSLWVVLHRRRILLGKVAPEWHKRSTAWRYTWTAPGCVDPIAVCLFLISRIMVKIDFASVISGTQWQAGVADAGQLGGEAFRYASLSSSSASCSGR
jgi:hypothetical protein